MTPSPDITQITYDTDGDILSYLEDGKQVNIYKNNYGDVSSIATGVVGDGTVEVFEYDEDTGEIIDSQVIPYGMGFGVAGKNIIYQGKKYRGMGVNFFDAITHTDIVARLAELKSYGVPFCRVMFGQYGAGGGNNSEWRLYLNNESLWWSRLDALVTAFENAGIGIIASMFFRTHTIPDLMYWKYGKRDALNAIGLSDSNSRKFMREYTEKCVRRYANRPGIFGWEYGNEPFSYSRYDLSPVFRKAFPPNGSGNNWTYSETPIPASVGSGTSDWVSIDEVYSSVQEWAAIVEKNDPHKRMTNAGSAFPFANSTNFRKPVPSGQLDNYSEWIVDPVTGKNPMEIWSPPNTSTFGAHIYQEATIPYWYWNNMGTNNVKPAGLAKYFAEYSHGRGKPCFLGEFGSLAGALGSEGGNVEEQGLFNSLLNSVITSKIDISCIWNYGLGNSSSAYVWNIDPDTTTSASTFINRYANPPNRDYQLVAIAAANNAINQLL